MDNSFFTTYNYVDDSLFKLYQDDEEEEISFEEQYPELIPPSFNLQEESDLQEYSDLQKEHSKVKEYSEDTKIVIPRKTTQITKFSSPKDFVNTLNDIYKQELQRKGLDPRYSKMLVALDAGETGWGALVKGDFNFGNITTNDNNWHVRTGKRKWRDFDSIEDYVSYKIDFLSRKRYKFFSSFSPNSNVSIAMQTLANRGYDPGNPNYGKLVAKNYDKVLKYLV